MALFIEVKLKAHKQIIFNYHNLKKIKDGKIFLIKTLAIFLDVDLINQQLITLAKWKEITTIKMNY